MKFTDRPATASPPSGPSVNKWQLLRVKLRSSGFMSGLMIVLSALSLLVLLLYFVWGSHSLPSSSSALFVVVRGIAILLALPAALLLLISGIRLHRHELLQDALHSGIVSSSPSAFSFMCWCCFVLLAGLFA